MPAPTDPKDAAIYHTILSDLHRMQASMLNLQAIAEQNTEVALREHFSREQNLVLARLNEWRQRRADIYARASDDFAAALKGGAGSAAPD